MTGEKLRIDKYLWAIRIFKTRNQAANAIHAGKVKSHGTEIKASKLVSVSDQYTIKTEHRDWLIEVTGLLDHRVQYEEALKYYVDLTPVVEKVKKQKPAFVEYTGKRMSKQGRPTKRNRREQDRFLTDI
ncbi:MAG TPA: S4 domain-containing protein [Chitinophagales bacterium]|nr:S4 domain-containing protein [Chitinophagales bacterium]